MLIAFTNTKGGVGKSTLAAHLAIWLFDRGYRVALLDTDGQRSAGEWVQNAEPGIAVRVATEMDAIRAAKAELLDANQIVVADSPGEEGDASRTVTFLADLAIVPLQPSKLDVRAIRSALKAVRLAQEMTGGTRPEAVLVLNGTRKRSVRAKKLRQQLMSLGFPLAESEVRRYDAICDSCDTAVTRMDDLDAKEAAADMDRLFTELVAPRLRAANIVSESSSATGQDEQAVGAITRRAANE
jgi:chromosome partitioning protein